MGFKEMFGFNGRVENKGRIDEYTSLLQEHGGEQQFLQRMRSLSENGDFAQMPLDQRQESITILNGLMGRAGVTETAKKDLIKFRTELEAVK
jgi:hypothetical protein